MNDDDIRSMLRVKADEATISSDAWDRIDARLDEVEARPAPHRLVAAAGVLVAAAVVAVVVGISARHQPPTSVTSDKVVATPPLDSRRLGLGCLPGTVETVATTFLDRRGIPAVAKPATFTDPEHAVVRFTDVDTAIHLHRNKQLSLWCIDAATSGTVSIVDGTYDRGRFRGTAVVTTGGRLFINYAHGKVGGDRRTDGPWFNGAITVTPRQRVPMSANFRADPYLTVDAVVRDQVGIVLGFAQIWASDYHVTSLTERSGVLTSAWPVADATELNNINDAQAEGIRREFQNAVNTARTALEDLCPGCHSLVDVGEVRQRGSEGTVPYELDGNPAGVVKVRRLGDRGIWYVTEITSSRATFAVKRSKGAVSVTIAASEDFLEWKTTLRPIGAQLVDEGWASPRRTAVATVKGDVETARWARIVLLQGDEGQRIVAMAIVPIP